MPIRRTDWKTEPLSPPFLPLLGRWRFSALDWARLKEGVRPQSQDDRWFIYAEGDWLHLHRSWTGYAIFQARFVHDAEGARLVEAWTTGDPNVVEVHRGADRELAAVLFYLGLARSVGAPLSERRPLEDRLWVRQGDITQLGTDAVVNAANTGLLGGGGVDGAIHRAAGPGLLQECRPLGGCPVGAARITGGHLLPAKHVIHTVGPVWRGGTAGEPAALASCYRESLRLAREAGASTVAFPGLSTGVFGYPAGRAAEIAVQTVRAELAAHALPEVVVLCTYDADATAVMRTAMG